METTQFHQNEILIKGDELDVPPREVDALELLIVFARRKRIVVVTAAVATAIAVIVSLLLPNEYTATTKLLPPQQSQSTSSLILNGLAGSGLGSMAALAGGGLGLKSPSDLYIGILKSRTIEDALLARFDLLRVYSVKRNSDARKRLEASSDIVAGKEGLISISVEDKDPRRAAAIANAYVDELRNVTQHLAISEASQRRLFFEQQVAQARDDLSHAEVALKETQQQTGMIQLDSQAKAVIEAVGNLRAQIAAKEVQLRAMHSFETDQNPDTILAQQQLSGLRDQLRKLEEQQGASGDPLVSTSKVPGVALEYVRRLRDVKYYEAIFDLLAKQYEAAKIDESRDAAIIQVLDPAVEPDRKSSPRRILIVCIGILLGFVAGSSYIVVAEATARMRQDPALSRYFMRLHTHLHIRR